MKKFFTSLMLAVLAIPAFSAEVPEPTMVMPINGVAGLFYGGISIVWGFNTLEENPEVDDLTCTLVWPDGHEQAIKGMIQDANGTETVPPFPEAEGKPYEHNALLFVNVNLDKDKFEPIYMKGKYKVIIPEGIVLIDVNSADHPLPGTEPEWVPNPAATLSFICTEGEDPSGDDEPGEGGELGIDNVTVTGEDVYFDIQGRRVVNPEHGIYIVKGKKVVK